MMPEMDGMELCRRVKTQFETCHIPLILLTAKTSDEDHVEGMSLGPMVISVNRSASLSCLPR